MSQENVEIVRRGYEHYQRTGEPDYSDFDPEIVYDVTRWTFDPGVHYGHEGVRKAMSRFAEQWKTMQIEPQDFVDGGDDVIVSIRLVGVGRESGVETTANAAHADLPWREDRSPYNLPDNGRSPRSRRAVGVAARRGVPTRRR